MTYGNQKHLTTALKISLFCIVVYFPVFLHLDVLPIQLWDESRLAVNAFEMSENHDYLITYFEGSPDMWNTKPPLMIWLQSFCIRWMGAGELAVRLPSAIAALLTAAALLIFSLKYLKDYRFGIIVVLILVTSQGYINTHAVRTGDYDALLTLFTTVYSLSFFLYMENGERRFLHIFFLGLTLAVMTKSVQAIILLPALFAYAFTIKKIGYFIHKWFLIDLLICVLIIGGYYLIREHYDAGYLHYVWGNDVWGRFMTTIEEHHEGFWYYLLLLRDQHFSFWFWLLPCGVIAGFLSPKKEVKNLALFLVILSVSYWLIISLGQSKMEQYALPLFPFLALLAGIFIDSVWLFLKNVKRFDSIFKSPVFSFILILLIFVRPYYDIVNKVYFPRVNDNEKDFYAISYYMQDAVKLRRSVKNHVVCYDGYNAPMLFYICALNAENQNILQKDWHDLKTGELIIASQPDVKSEIENEYLFEAVDSFNNVKEYRITGKKELIGTPEISSGL